MDQSAASRDRTCSSFVRPLDIKKYDFKPYSLAIFLINKLAIVMKYNKLDFINYTL